MSDHLSVVIPHLNEPSGNLSRCLSALEAQRGEGLSIDVIVVDNGSLVMPHAECEGLDCVRLVREPIPGPGPARNLGASLSRSDLLAFIDADCIPQPGWIKTIVETMENRPDIDILGGDISIEMTDPKKPTDIELYEKLYSYRAQLYVEKYGFSATGNMAVRRTVFAAVGPFGGIATMEDTEWGQEATKLGYRIAFAPEASVLTPSCKSFAELARRWDRHVAHQFNQSRSERLALVRWLSTAMIVAASPVVEVARILRAKEISGFGNRLKAFICLTRIRLYRARLMIRLARTARPAPMVQTWNRTID